jgi:hypothetical protein
VRRCCGRSWTAPSLASASPAACSCPLLAALIAKAEAGRYRAKPVRVFGFGQIVEAPGVMEDGTAAGKMAVAVS